MNALDYFDRIVCINRDDRPERWQQCQREFAKANILERVVRLPAIVRHNLEEGCRMSHQQAVAEAKAARTQRLLILEDDVEFINLAVLPQALEELATLDWHIFYLGGYPSESPKNGTGLAVPIDACPNLMRVTRGYLTTHAYAVSENVYDEYLHATDAIDRWLAYSIQPTHFCAAARNMIAIQRDSFSDIKQAFCPRTRMLTLHNRMTEKLP